MQKPLFPVRGEKTRLRVHNTTIWICITGLPRHQPNSKFSHLDSRLLVCLFTPEYVPSAPQPFFTARYVALISSLPFHFRGPTASLPLYLNC